MIELTVLSAAFVLNAAIPRTFTCKGENISPPLRWGDVPPATASIAIVCDDPDAPGGVWSHWVLFNLPPDTRDLAQGQSKAPKLPNGAVQGLNDFGKPGYDGPCPPPGKPHRYVFRVYALDTRLDLGSAATRQDLLAAIEGHVLARGELTGIFQR